MNYGYAEKYNNKYNISKFNSITKLSMSIIESNPEQIINVDMGIMTDIFMAPVYLSDLFIEAGIKGDFEEQTRIIEQMRIQVAKGNVRPDPPKTLINLFESTSNAQFKINSDIDEYGEEHVKINISDKDYVSVEGKEKNKCALLICGVTDVREIDEESGTVMVGYNSSKGEKSIKVPLERVFSGKQRKMFSI